LCQIKKAYKKLALKHHPDKNQDRLEEANEKIRELTEAYSILSDPEKKGHYDKFGTIDEDQMHGMNGMNGVDISEILKGMGINIPGMGGNQEEMVQDETITITLEELYKGATKNHTISVDSKCDDCDGFGSLDKTDCDCEKCNGSGVEIKLIRMGPMAQQVRAPCESCDGEGRQIKKNNKCKKCHGSGTIGKIIEKKIKITENFDHGTKMRLKQMGNYNKNTKKNCDIIISFNVKFPKNSKISVMEGQKYDLLLEKDITIKDAFTGFNMHFTHLNGKHYNIKFDEVIEDGDVKIALNQGLPNSTDETKLLIKFNIKYPKRILNKEDYEKFINVQETNTLEDDQLEEELEVIDVKVYKENMEREQMRNQRHQHMHMGGAQGVDPENCIIS